MNKKSKQIRINAELHRLLKIRSATNGVTIGALIEAAFNMKQPKRPRKRKKK